MDNSPKCFPCKNDDCNMIFNNENTLKAHVKRHDMVLNLGPSKSNLFSVDQTPTPTRFIRNCDEVGLFQDLQNVNPFEETFRRAIEQTKNGNSNLTTPLSNILNDDSLHTPLPNFTNIADNTFITNRQPNASNNGDNEDIATGATIIKNETDQNVQDGAKSKSIKIVKTQMNNDIKQSEAVMILNKYNTILFKTNILENTETNVKKINQLSSVSSNVVLPRLQQIPLSEKDAEQILTSNNIKSGNHTKLNSIKEHLKESLLKNKKKSTIESTVIDNESADMPKIHQVSPIIIPNSLSIITTNLTRDRSLCKILPKVSVNQETKSVEISKSKLSLKQKVGPQKMITKQKPIVTKDSVDEQRQEYLARSRAAASRWRVKKKGQIRDLISRNQQLENENSWLRSECTQLKKMLLAHKDCSVTQMTLGHNIAVGSAIILPANIPEPEVEIIVEQVNNDTTCS